MMTKILQIFLIQYFPILIDLVINTHTLEWQVIQKH